MISFKNRARPPNEISEQTAKKLLKHLISKGRMVKFSSSQKPPYDTYVQVTTPEQQNKLIR